MSFDVKTRISQLKASAKARGLNINLDLNKYQLLINLGCFFCGNNLKNEKGYCLDRVDSSKGYILSNIVACCKICNRAKSNMDIWEFVEWSKQLNFHTQKKLAQLENNIMLGFNVTKDQEDNLYRNMIKEQNLNLGRLKVLNK